MLKRQGDGDYDCDQSAHAIHPLGAGDESPDDLICNKYMQCIRQCSDGRKKQPGLPLAGRLGQGTKPGTRIQARFYMVQGESLGNPVQTELRPAVSACAPMILPVGVSALGLSLGQCPKQSDHRST